jgi:hypothetical protein
VFQTIKTKSKEWGKGMDREKETAPAKAEEMGTDTKCKFNFSK